MIGTVQTVGLAAGYLFLSLNSGILSGTETLLFGTFLGVTQGQVVTLLIIAVVALALLALGARPLLFSTVDRELARASGIPVAALDVLFLLLLALAVAATSQITGVLLVFAVLVAPPAAAQQLTSGRWPDSCSGSCSRCWWSGSACARHISRRGRSASTPRRSRSPYT